MNAAILLAKVARLLRIDLNLVFDPVHYVRSRTVKKVASERKADGQSLFQQWLSLRDQINAHADSEGPECQALELARYRTEAAIKARPCTTAVELAELYIVETCVFTVNDEAFDRHCAALAGLPNVHPPHSQPCLETNGVGT